MKKREFIKKAGMLSATLLAVPASGFNENSGRDPEIINREEQKIPLKLVIGSDHAGFPLKVPLIKLLESWNFSVKDVGSFNPEPVDFPDIALLLADEIKSNRAEKGIMVCGTGVELPLPAIRSRV